MKNKLKQIFDYYKKKYKLKTKLIFDEKEGCRFSFLSNTIHYDLYEHSMLNASKLSEEVIACLGNMKEFKVTKKQALVWILLHEIRHAIDYTCFNKRWNREINNNNIYNIYSFYNINYHNNLPFEKRANKFASKELDKIGMKKC